MPDVYGYSVSQKTLVDVCSEEDVLCLTNLAHHLFSPNLWGLATLTKLNTEMRICSATVWYSNAYIRTTVSVSLPVDDLFVPENIISSVINTSLLTLIIRC